MSIAIQYVEWADSLQAVYYLDRETFGPQIAAACVAPEWADGHAKLLA